MPEPLASRLGPLESETIKVAPVTSSLEVRDRLGKFPLLEDNDCRAGLEVQINRVQRTPRPPRVEVT